MLYISMRKGRYMKKSLLILLGLLLSACAQEPYRLQINSAMGGEHGQSIYFRSNMRNTYAAQIRRVLGQKFGEIGMKTATSAENADFIAIFDVETFYADSGTYVNTTYNNTANDAPLFTDSTEGSTLDYSGNANVKVNHDKTCFTLKIGRKNTSNLSYDSAFCSEAVEDIEEMLPKILDIYGKYGNYERADVGVQCLSDTSGNISCDTVHDKQKAFMNSLWIDSTISEDY